MDDLPPPIKVTEDKQSSTDDSLVEGGFKIKNPFQNFFDWLKNFIKKNQNITIKIPIIGVLVALASFSAGLGSGYHWGFNSAISTFFPNSSPILHRAISIEGIIQKSQTKYYLKSTDNNLWTLKPNNPTVNLAGYINQQVTAKGNLTKENFVIEVSEIIPLDSPVLPSPKPYTLDPIPSSDPSNPAAFPDLYSGLNWETTQKKVLIFTSGKRKIEQEGVYLESNQLSSFPQDFINYYLQEFKNNGFKETLNSISPDGITITYAKDDLFLTFGIKNILDRQVASSAYSGSADKKQLVGFKAFIEHN